jgi:hypothetical protein
LESFLGRKWFVGLYFAGKKQSESHNLYCRKKQLLMNASLIHGEILKSRKAKEDINLTLSIFSMENGFCQFIYCSNSQRRKTDNKQETSWRNSTAAYACIVPV